MFRRIIMGFVCAATAIAGFAAQLTATLQNGDKVTPFFGSSALTSALAAAVDGDVITLSPGEFKGTISIDKSISIIGTYAFSTDASKATILPGIVTVSADNVNIEGIRFTTQLLIKGTDHLSVSRCWISSTDDVEKDSEHKYHDNTIMTDCMIGEYKALLLSKNTILRNCCINRFEDLNESAYPALIEGCNIPVLFYNNNSGVIQPYAVYRKCFLGLYSYVNYSNNSIAFSSPSEFHENVFYCTYKHTYYNKLSISFGSCATSNNQIINSTSVGYSDGDISLLYRYDSTIPFTSDDISYGPSNFKEYPAIPAINTAEIDTETNADGTLHVKIEATARD